VNFTEQVMVFKIRFYIVPYRRFIEFYYTYVKVREGVRTSVRTAVFPLAPVTIPDSHRARALLLYTTSQGALC